MYDPCNIFRLLRDLVWGFDNQEEEVSSISGDDGNEGASAASSDSEECVSTESSKSQNTDHGRAGKRMTVLRHKDR